jgi:hypothetical protein
MGSFLETVTCSLQREVMIVFDSGEPFLLCGGKDFTVNDKSSGRLVIKGRDSQNAYQLRLPILLKQRVDKWRNGRPFCKHQKPAD